jgi:phosphoribosylaminoimidazole-succinocarboxamide synthase
MGQVLIEGKTKVIADAGGGEVLIRSKDDITAGDGAKHDVLDGKAAASTRTAWATLPEIRKKFDEVAALTDRFA